MNNVVTIAGSDPTGGAGMQADLATFAAHNCKGYSVVTAITAQNFSRVHAVEPVSMRMIRAQLDAAFEEKHILAAKTGMLVNEEIVQAVSEKLSQGNIFLVVDPVLYSTNGTELLSPAGREALEQKIFPLATLLTPNIPEAEVLTGRKIISVNDMKEAAKKIYSLGVKNVLVKGGHAPGSDNVVDVFYDGENFNEYSSERIRMDNVHGTGCVLSAAVTANLANGYLLGDAIDRARKYVWHAMNKAVKTPSGFALAHSEKFI